MRRDTRILHEFVKMHTCFPIEMRSNLICWLSYSTKMINFDKKIYLGDVGLI